MTKVAASITSVTSGVRLQALARDTILAIVIQVGGISLTYLSRVALARWMGETEYGIYEYVISWSLLLGIAAALGLPRTALRFVSQYRVTQSWGLLRGLFQSSVLIVLLLGSLIATVCTGLILAWNHYHPFVYAIPLLIGIWLVPLQALMNMLLETSRAMDALILAYAPSRLIWPVAILLGGFILFEQRYTLTGVSVLIIATLLFLGVLLVQLGVLWYKLDREIGNVEPEYAYRTWLKVSLVLLVQGTFFILMQQIDIVMVGSFLGPEDAGLYGAAVKTALWVGIVLQTVNMVAAPSFAMLYTQGDMAGLQQLVKTVTLWIFWPSLTIATGLIVFAPQVMGLFGSAFAAASWQLKILVLGQLVSALCGSVANLMVMTGHQNKSLKVFGIACATNIALNAIGIPLFGSVGAAIATAVAMIMWNIWLNVLVVKYVGVSPSIFSFLFTPQPQAINQPASELLKPEETDASNSGQPIE